MPSLSHRRNSAAKLFVNGKRADGLRDLTNKIGKRVSRYSTAAERAKSSLARRFQPTAKREIRKEYGVKQATLNKRMAVASGIRQKGDYVSLQASVRRISLLEFGGKWGGRETPGATASIVLGGSKTYRGAFVASVGWRGSSGKAVKGGTATKAIYARSMGANGRRAGRGPLVRLYGPSVFEMLSPGSHTNSPALRVRTAVISQLESFHVTELARQISLELRRG